MRRLAVVVGGIVLVVVVGIALVGLFSEPGCPDGDESPVPVLVANKLIPKGTSGDAIAKRRMYTSAAIRCIETKPGAVSDPAYLFDLEAAFDIFPGQQFTEADFNSR